MMKAFFSILFCAPLICLSQQGWVVVTLQADQYSGETSWLISDETGFVGEESPGVIQSNSFNQQVVFLPAGEYTFTIFDSFGDGICCGFGEGWFSLTNACGVDTAVYDFNTNELTIPFEILPCPPPIFGCMEPGALDYNPWANAPGPCSFPPEQCDEGSNNIVVTVTPDTYAGEISWDIMTFPDGEIVADGSGYTVTGVPVIEAVCLPVGSEFKVNVYDTFGDGMCGSCYGGVDGNLSVTTLCGDTLYYIGDTTQFESVGSDILTVGLCVPPIPQGCTDPWFVEYDPHAVIDDGSCETDVIYGCTIPGSINFNPDANTLETEDNCEFTFTITDGAGDGWFGSWIGVVQGDEIFGPFTMHPNDGFEKEIQIPLYSGEAIDVMFFTQGNAETTANQCGFYFDGPNGTFMEGGTNPWADAIKKFPYRYIGTPLCDDFCEPVVVGCTLPFACNYNPEANMPDICTFPIEYYDCTNVCINDTDGDGVCDELEVVGCQDPTAYNYNADATDPGECEEVVFGCTDPTQFNYDPTANTDNGNCVAFAYGCMDPLALNYDEDANTELEDSCIDAVAGCMDLDAFNFDPNANVADNENCLYDAGCITGPGEPYWANDYCYSWVIEVDPYCCETAWDAVCAEMYNYCGAGVTSVETVERSLLHFFPNPTSGLVNIQAPVGTVITLLDARGRVVETTTGSTIELPSPGPYVIMANYQGRIKRETIVRQ
jgi:hypothetical protein